MSDKIHKTEAQWRAELPADVYRVLRDKGTEAAYSGALVDEHGAGQYLCGGCEQALFDAAHKFDSGSGWPSFYRPIAPQRLGEVTDASHGMRRTEVLCGRCDGHLGHVFEDGPPPSGLRYCINSAALKFVPQ